MSLPSLPDISITSLILLDGSLTALCLIGTIIGIYDQKIPIDIWHLVIFISKKMS